MTEDLRMARIIALTIVVIVALIAGTILTSVWFHHNETGPNHKYIQERQIEEIHACARAVDVTSCLRSVEIPGG